MVDAGGGKRAEKLQTDKNSLLSVISMAQMVPAQLSTLPGKRSDIDFASQIGPSSLQINAQRVSQHAFCRITVSDQ